MMPDERADSADTIPMPPPLVYAAPLLLGVALRKSVPGLPLPSPLRQIAGAVLLAGGAFLAGWFVRTMRRSDTTLNPRKPVSTLVTNGPFEITRNPGYLGMAAISAGIALLANALPALLFLPAVLMLITRGVIEPEEQYLERRFGDEYREYTERTPRWL